ncbi:MAG: ABC transporter substrate-binding protein [Candidatus Tectomicrobia bacterium]|uniref:ABC transporter substrate-binding protein n=1 Tax=Tectimicrobiota bacterium TaxID=2528274 RepID=A0A933GLV6_UNCTE|nr:ABC transporter substrate-binding protein [Candidatus Tectomicrobia bacterium]
MDQEPKIQFDQQITRRDFVKKAAIGGGVLLGTLSGGIPIRSAKAAQFKDKPVVIGLVPPLTGTYAANGQDVVRGITLGAKEVNERGGLLGREVKIIPEDTKGDPATAVRKAQKLVDKDGAHFLMGVNASHELLALAPVAKDLKTILVSAIASNEKFTGENCSRYGFRISFNDYQRLMTLISYAKEQKFQKYYGIGADYAWGHAAIDGAVSELKKAGKEFVAQDFSPLGTTDYATYISKIKQAKPDAVWVALAGNDIITFMQQAKQFGLAQETQLFLIVIDIFMLKTIGDAALGVLAQSEYSFAWESPANKKFVEQWLKDYNNELPSWFGANNYNAFNMLVKAIETAKTIDTAKVIEAFEGLTHDGLLYSFKMRKEDHQAMHDGFVCKVVKSDKHPVPLLEIKGKIPGEKVILPANQTGCKMA